MFKPVSEFCGTIVGLAVIAGLLKLFFAAAFGILSLLALLKFVAS